MSTKIAAYADNLFLVVVLMSSTCTLGQEVGGQSPNRADTGTRVVSLNFKEDRDSPKPPASPVMSYPIRCGPDGTAYLEMLQPPDYLERRLFSISAKVVHEFVLQTITDLTHIDAIDYFPSESELTYLISGAEGSEETTRTITLPNGENREEKWPKSEIHAYVARFDPIRKYLGATAVDDEIVPEKIASFPSGNLLIWELDRLTKSPRLILVSSSGEILRYLEVPGKLDNDMVPQDSSH